MRYVDAVEGTRALRVVAAHRRPVARALHVGGQGTAGRLARCEDPRAVCRPGVAGAPQTDRSVSSLPSLIAALAEVRANGYATNYEESEEGVGSVAIALRDAGGTALAAVAVAVPTIRLSRERRRGDRIGADRAGQTADAVDVRMSALKKHSAEHLTLRAEVRVTYVT